PILIASTLVKIEVATLPIGGSFLGFVERANLMLMVIRTLGVLVLVIPFQARGGCGGRATPSPNVVTQDTHETMAPSLKGRWQAIQGALVSGFEVIECAGDGTLTVQELGETRLDKGRLEPLC